MAKVVKTDYAKAKLLSYDCKYLDNIWTVNFKYFDEITKDIYDNKLSLEDSACRYKQNTFFMHSPLFKYLKRFCLTYNIDGKYGEKNYNLLFYVWLNTVSFFLVI